MKEIPVNLDYSRLCQCISLGIRSGLSPELCVELAVAVVTQTEIRESCFHSEAARGRIWIYRSHHGIRTF